MFNLLLAISFIITTFSVKSMEITVDKKDKKFKKSASFPFSNKTSTKNLNATITTLQSEHPFVIAAESNNEVLVKNYLNNPYFNPNIHRYKTAFHACIENKNYHLLSLFLADPRINSCIKNKALQTGHDILKQHRLTESKSTLKEEMYEWQIKLFARLTLDRTTNTMCTGLKTSYQQGNITDTIIMDAIEMIKKKIDTIAQNQIVSKTEDEYVEDRQLPKTACFPKYATKNGFMIKKMQFILSLNDHEFMYDITL